MQKQKHPKSVWVVNVNETKRRTQRNSLTKLIESNGTDTPNKTSNNSLATNRNMNPQLLAYWQQFGRFGAHGVCLFFVFFWHSTEVHSTTLSSKIPVHHFGVPIEAKFALFASRFTHLKSYRIFDFKKKIKFQFLFQNSKIQVKKKLNIVTFFHRMIALAKIDLLQKPIQFLHQSEWFSMFYSLCF